MDKNRKSIFLLTFSNYFNSFLGMIRGFITAFLLGPSLYGVWATLNLFLQFSKYSQLGLFAAQTKEVPYWREKNNSEKAEVTASNVFNFSLLSAFIIGSGLIIYAFLRRGSYNNIWFLGLLTIAVLAIADMLFGFFHNYLRAFERFDLLASFQNISAIFTLIFVVGGVFLGGIYGAYIGSILSYLLIFVYLFLKLRFRIHPALDFSLYRKLIIIGMPILLSELAYFALMSIDRVMVVRYLGSTAMGYYSLSFQVVMVVIIMVTGVSYVYFPKVIRLFASSEDDDPLKANKAKLELRHTVLNTTKLIISLFPAGIVVLALSAQAIIKFFLPAYINSLGVINLLLFAIYFIGSGCIMANTLIAMNRQKALLKIYVLIVAVNIVCNYLAIRFGFNISGVAFATLLGYLVYLIMVLRVGSRLLKFKLAEIFPLLLLSSFLLALQLFLISFILRLNICASAGRACLSLIALSLVVLIFNIPSIVFLIRKGLIRELILTIKEKINIKNLRKADEFITGE